MPENSPTPPVPSPTPAPATVLPPAGAQENITQPQLDTKTGETGEGAATAGLDKDPVHTAQASAATDPALGGRVDQPGAGVDQPASDVDRQTFGIDRQATGVDRNASGVGQNVSNVDAADAKDRPASGNGQNAGSVDKAKETDPRPPVTQAPPPRELRPGELGYAPPARIANETGVLTNEHLGYNPGSDASVNIHGQVPLAMPAPAAATLSSSTEGMKPSLLSKQSATVAMSKMWADMQTWIMDMPHALDGHLAVVAQFARDMKARQNAMITAHQLGRTLEPDAVDKATFEPPPEFFALRGVAGEIVTLKKVYAAALAAKGIELSADDQRTVDQIMSRVEPLADGPKAPDEVKPDPEPLPEGKQPEQAAA